MKYMGSKNRIAKELLAVMLKDISGVNVFYDVCCGGGNMIDKVPSKFKRVGIDNNKYVIALLKALRDGWEPPEITEEVYKFIKKNKDDISDCLVGYAGTQLSFGCTWFGSYRRDNLGKRNYSREAISNVLKQAKILQGVEFVCEDYDCVKYRKDSVIYIDKPYQGTAKYSKDGFPHAEFWQWARDMSNAGYRLYISEYNAPDDFKCIWEKELSVTLSKDSNNKKATEKLFIYDGTTPPILTPPK